MQYVSGEWVDAPVVQQAQSVEQPEKRMVAVLPFIEKEMDQVESFLLRSLKLCGIIPRTLYLLPFKGIDTTIHRVAETAFAQVGIIQDSEGKTSDWQGRELIRDAAGPNSLFRQASWFFYTKKIGSWLWLEPDCWPMTDRWLYDIEREYFETGKPFMGVKMASSDGREYMNGVAVYPWNAVQYAPFLVQASTWTQHPEMEVGFDIAGGKDVLAKSHITRKIQLMGALAGGNANVRPETVLCHGRIDLSGKASENNAIQTDVKPAVSSNDKLPAQKPLEDLSGGYASSAHTADADKPETQAAASTPPKIPPKWRDSDFLDRYGVARDAQTEVFGDASPHAAPCVPSHECPVQETPIPTGRRYSSVESLMEGEGVSQEVKDEYRKLQDEDNATSQPKDGSIEYGWLTDEIRDHVMGLVNLWKNQPHRKVMIVKELRKAKLVPKHFR